MKSDASENVQQQPDRRPYAIAIVVATDREYQWPALLALLSAGIHASETAVCVLIGDDLDGGFVASAAALFAHRRLRFEYLEADLEQYAALPLGSHVSRATYGRLLGVAATSAFAARTLYLDADTLAIGDISSLATVELAGSHVVAAVRDRVIPTCGSPGGLSNLEPRGVDLTAPYFNAGVLVIDNDAWARDDVSGRVLTELEDGPEVAFADQGGLNALLQDRWTELPVAWNHQLIRTPGIRVGPLVLSRHYCVDLRKTRILHFFQSVKPWDHRYPPGALTRLYQGVWAELLPTPVPATQPFRGWLRKRY